jgi:hypothetical protein
MNFFTGKFEVIFSSFFRFFFIETKTSPLNIDQAKLQSWLHPNWDDVVVDTMVIVPHTSPKDVRKCIAENVEFEP